MKLKTIKKVITDKIDDWAMSVNNEKIRNIIKNHTIVTGGCIASMLLKEDVNDFDVYIDSKDNLKLITEHYISLINDPSIEIIDGQNYKNFIYGEDNCNDMSHQKARCCSNLDQDRIKIFFPDKGIYKIDEKNGDAKKYSPLCLSANAITLTDKIQIVVRFHGCPEKIHENYDFVHATNYWYKGELNLNQKALESLITKELFYIGSKYPVTSIIRSKKFIKRNFTISAGTYLKICYQISQLDLNDLVVLEDQLAGVDVAYFNILIEALSDRCKDPSFSLSYNYISELIERIFN